ncbi:DUF222 domain-containing protein [Enemella sp. A6]|uniref:HNH endonuclease signature motif containing protein n=1 Tax=Enemella sp. A6 TaxID=3440152 RepID=UPI003EBD4E8D
MSGEEIEPADEVDEAIALLRRLADKAWTDTGDDELMDRFAGTQVLASMVRALELNLLGELERRKTTGQRHGLDTAEWWQAQGQVSGRATRLRVRLARELPAFGLVQAALAAGELSGEQAAAVVSGLVRLPSDAPAEAITDAQTHLLREAQRLDLKGLHRAAQTVAEVVLPEQAAASQADAAIEQQQRARRGRYLSYGRDEADGVMWFRGRVPLADGEVLVNAINAIAHKAWRSEAATRAAARGTGAVDETESSTMSQLRADALIELAGRGPEGSPGRPTLTVLVPVENLLDDLGMGTLAESGEQIDPAELRRLACDAGVLPAVLGGDSTVLDLGREQRLVTPDLRRALVIRDGGCVFPGCDRPPGDCEAHHIVPWVKGGSTDMSNLTLLCPHHHRLVEPHVRSIPGSRWQVRMGADGLAEVLPPQRVDPQRRPLRHRRMATGAQSVETARDRAA